MSDHIYEKMVLHEALSSGGQMAFAICLERKPSRVDAEEGLKIMLNNEGVAHASKNALPRHGIDTGVILCGGKANTYIERTLEIMGPRATIADALNLATADNEVNYVDVTGRLWKDIDTPEDLVKGREVYWQILRKEIQAESGLVSKHLIKPLSTRLSIAIYCSKYVEPLAISLLAFLLALLTSFLLSRGEFLQGGLLAGFTLLISEAGEELVNLYNRKMSWRLHTSLLLDRFSDIAIVIGLSIPLLSLDEKVFLLSLIATANIILVGYMPYFLKSLGIRTRFLRTIPATRDALLFVVFLSSILSLPIYSLYYLAIAPVFYIVCSVILTFYGERDECKSRRKSKHLEPEIVVEKSKIVKTVEGLISNSLKLAILLLVFHMITPVAAGIRLIVFEDFIFESDHLLSLLSLIVTIYFGYQILLALKFLVDVSTKRLVTVLKISEFTLRHILIDLLYMFLAAFLWVYLPSQLKLVPYFGENLARLAALAILAFFILILYDAVKILYKTFGDIYRKMIEKIAEKLHEGSEPSKNQTSS